MNNKNIHIAIYLAIILTVMGCNSNTKWVEDLPKPWTLTENEFSNILQKFGERYPDFYDRLKYFSKWQIGKPYKIFCLGEINGSATSHNYYSETNRFEPLNVTGPAKYQLSFTPDSSKVLVPFCIGYYTAKYNHFNAGQDATFGGVTSPSSTYTDSNGVGSFYYQPPTGALALCTQNLPTPTIEDPAEHFKCVHYLGPNPAASVTISSVSYTHLTLPTKRIV